MAKGLSNDYVDKLCRKILNNHTFLGVYPCDLHPTIDRRRNCSIIFNTGDSTSAGDHFVAIYINKNATYYFDSFGGSIDLDPNIKSFIRKIPTKRIIENTQTIQSDFSQFCGFFCVAYLLSKDLNLSEDYFKSCFNKKNLLENDQNVIYFIQKHLQ